MKKNQTSQILLGNTDISHYRLTELVHLADSCHAFYEWVERIAKNKFKNSLDLSTQLLTLNKTQIKNLVKTCLDSEEENIPKMFNGKGDEYLHKRACFYFFSWLVRDAPQQRLSRLIAEFKRKNKKAIPSDEVVAETLSLLIVKYRKLLKTFEWDAIREVFIDRLEGSRRAIKGSIKELIARRGIAVALSSFYEEHQDYGAYKDYEISKKQVKVGKRTYDVCVTLLADDTSNNVKVYIPVKTRETRGGGHAHLFTRDVLEAARALKKTGKNAFIIPIIIAADWSSREEEEINQVVDGLLLIRKHPGKVEVLPDEEQLALTQLMSKILTQEVSPKKIV